jgi:hypothetical protein
MLSLGPPHARHWRMIWAIPIDASKDRYDQVDHPKHSDYHRENDGNQLVDREIKYHQTDKK